MSHDVLGVLPLLSGGPRPDVTSSILCPISRVSVRPLLYVSNSLLIANQYLLTLFQW